MLTNYWKTAVRHLSKNLGFSVLNILGLAAGLTICLLLLLAIPFIRSPV